MSIRRKREASKPAAQNEHTPNAPADTKILLEIEKLRGEIFRLAQDARNDRLKILAPYVTGAIACLSFVGVIVNLAYDRDKSDRLANTDIATKEIQRISERMVAITSEDYDLHKRTEAIYAVFKSSQIMNSEIAQKLQDLRDLPVLDQKNSHLSETDRVQINETITAAHLQLSQNYKIPDLSKQAVLIENEWVARAALTPDFFLYFQRPGIYNSYDFPAHWKELNQTAVKFLELCQYPDIKADPNSVNEAHSQFAKQSQEFYEQLNLYQLEFMKVTRDKIKKSDFDSISP